MASPRSQKSPLKIRVGDPSQGATIETWQGVVKQFPASGIGEDNLQHAENIRFTGGGIKERPGLTKVNSAGAMTGTVLSIADPSQHSQKWGDTAPAFNGGVIWGESGYGPLTLSTSGLVLSGGGTGVSADQGPKVLGSDGSVVIAVCNTSDRGPLYRYASGVTTTPPPTLFGNPAFETSPTATNYESNCGIVEMSGKYYVLKYHYHGGVSQGLKCGVYDITTGAVSSTETVDGTLPAPSYGSMVGIEQPENWFSIAATSGGELIAVRRLNKLPEYGTNAQPLAYKRSAGGAWSALSFPVPSGAASWGYTVASSTVQAYWGEETEPAGGNYDGYSVHVVAFGSDAFIFGTVGLGNPNAATITNVGARMFRYSSSSVTEDLVMESTPTTVWRKPGSYAFGMFQYAGVLYYVYFNNIGDAALPHGDLALGSYSSGVYSNTASYGRIGYVSFATGATAAINMTGKMIAVLAGGTAYSSDTMPPNVLYAISLQGGGGYTINGGVAAVAKAS